MFTILTIKKKLVHLTWKRSFLATRALALLVTLTIMSCHENNPAPAEADKESEKNTIDLAIDGVSRSYIVYLPMGYNNAGKMPCILMFHGGGAKANSMFTGTDFMTIADQDKVVLIAPQGVSDSWNDGRNTDAHTLGIDDISFVKQLLSSVTSQYPIDPTKVYATGISNGGFMVSRLACDLSGSFAAMAAVAATMGEDVPYSSCNPSHPLPIIYMHGTSDPVIPFEGGLPDVGAQSVIVSHFQVLEKWVKINQCNTTPTVTDLPDIKDDGTTIKETKYTRGVNKNEVVGYEINNGGHTWPQGQQYLPESVIGKVSQDMNASEVIWEFFKGYQLN